MNNKTAAICAVLIAFIATMLGVTAGVFGIISIARIKEAEARILEIESGICRNEFGTKVPCVCDR